MLVCSHGKKPRGRILLRRDSRVSFQRDAMWHFNALFQPAKCLLICKTRSRFELLFRRVSPTFVVSLSLSLSSSVSSPFPVAATVRSPSPPPPPPPLYLSRFCFWYPFPSIGSRGPDFRVALLLLLLRSRFSYLLKATPSICGTSRYGKRVYETLLPV